MTDNPAILSASTQSVLKTKHFSGIQSAIYRETNLMHGGEQVEKYSKSLSYQVPLSIARFLYTVESNNGAIHNGGSEPRRFRYCLLMSCATVHSGQSALCAQNQGCNDIFRLRTGRHC